MVNAQLNYFDMVVLSIMFLSCIFALFRGFVKEILSLGAWVGAAFITVKFFRPLSVQLQPHFANPMAGSIAATVLLYIGSLIGFAIINRIIIKIVRSGSDMGMLDNLLGFLFGALRGSFIVSLAYLMMSLVIKPENRPEWLEKALTRPYVEMGANMLGKLAPGYIDELATYHKKAKESMESTIKTRAEENIHNQLQEKIKDPKELEKIDNNPDDEINDPANTSGIFNKFLKDLNKTR